MLRNIRTFLKKFVPTLHSHQEKLRIFPENTITVTYKRKKKQKKPNSYLYLCFLKQLKKIIAQLIEEAEDVIFVKIF